MADCSGGDGGRKIPRAPDVSVATIAPTDQREIFRAGSATLPCAKVLNCSELQVAYRRLSHLWHTFSGGATGFG